MLSSFIAALFFIVALLFIGYLNYRHSVDTAEKWVGELARQNKQKKIQGGEK